MMIYYLFTDSMVANLDSANPIEDHRLVCFVLFLFPPPPAVLAAENIRLLTEA